MTSQVGSGFGNSSGSSTSASPSWTRPAGITTGDIETVVLVENGTSTTLTATGWTVTGPVTISTGRAWALTRTLASTDSGTSPSVSLSGAQRWAVAGAVWTGVSGVDQVVSASDDVAGSTTLTLAGYTPGGSNYFAVAAMGGIRTFSVTDGIGTYPSGYTAVSGADGVTSQTAANDVEAILGTKQLSGSGAQSSITGAWAGNSRDINFVVVLIPSTVAVAPSDTAASTTGQQTLTVTGQVPGSDTGAGTDALGVTARATDGDTAAAADTVTIGVSSGDSGGSSNAQQTLAVTTGTPVADTGAAADQLTATTTGTVTDTAAATDALTVLQLAGHGVDAAAATDSVTVVKSDLVQIKRPAPGGATSDPPLTYGEPGLDTDGAIRVGPFGGALLSTRPRTLMSGPNTVRTVTTNYTVTTGDWVIIGNGSSITLTLPDPATVPGWRYQVKNIHSSSLTVGTAASTIDGGSTVSHAQWVAHEYVSDGTQWLTL